MHSRVSGDRDLGHGRIRMRDLIWPSGQSGDLTDNQDVEDVLDQVFEGVVRLTLDD